MPAINDHTKFVKQWASSNGASVEVTGGGHLRVVLQNGKVIITSQSPRSAANARKTFVALARRLNG